MNENDYTSAFDLVEDIEHRVEAYVREACKPALAQDLGLDQRAAYGLWVSNDNEAIIIRKAQKRSMEYYGGFEYVDREHVREMGNYVFYFRECERVHGHLEEYEEKHA